MRAMISQGMTLVIPQVPQINMALAAEVVFLDVPQSLRRTNYE
jgi:hypothetical protein